MNIDKTEKIIDRSKMNIGVELECLIVHAGTLEDISPEESQQIFKKLNSEYGWTEQVNKKETEVQAVSKKIKEHTIIIKLDFSYAIFEITTLHPVPSLEDLEQLHSQTFADFLPVLRQLGLMIWPLGVAPASTGLLALPHATKQNIVDDQYYSVIGRVDHMARFFHITSHQVCIDTPLEKIIPAVNALFKNLGLVVEQFANCPVKVGNRFYKEGRYYWWNDSHPFMRQPIMTARTHLFPEHEFRNLDDFFRWVFRGYGAVMRNGWAHTFKDPAMTVDRFLRERTAVAVDPDENEVQVTLQKEDIELFLNFFWIDFKPHFDFNQSYSLEEFLEAYQSNNLDSFFYKHCIHSWIEVRPCSPHFEDNAMVIPRYFHKIFSSLDKFIAESAQVTWKEAKQNAGDAIGFL